MKVLKARYLLKFEDGRQENPDDLFRRVAKAIANSDKEYNDFKHEETEKIFCEGTVTNSAKPPALATGFVIPSKLRLEQICSRPS